MKPILFALVAAGCYANASLIKFGITQQVPDLWQVSGYILAAGAVVLVTKGGPAK